MSAALICLINEHDREKIKDALASHIPLIITEDRPQCLEAVKQKAHIHIAFIGVCNEKGKPDLKVFDEISALNPGLKVIAVGDQDTESAAAEAVRHGASGHIVMPASANALLTMAR